MNNNEKYKSELSMMLSNMVNSYKLFWLKGIFIEVINGNNEIGFKNIACRMISESWNIVVKYRPNLGTSDQINDIVKVMQEKGINKDIIDKERIYDELLKSPEKDIKELYEKFYSYVPYRLLSPFYKNDLKGKTDSEQNRIIEEKSQQDNEILYKLYHKDKLIKVNKNWSEYFINNKKGTAKWIDSQIEKYIIRKNPGINFEYEGNEILDDLNILKTDNPTDTLDFIYNYITSSGYTYDKSLIKNIYLSLKTKPFLILSGISGTGKSKIIELFAKALGATAKNGRFNLIPVKPDWSDSTELLGYKNIEGKFIPGRITEICNEAMMHKELPYFIVLDEMNLARVEYYFSDILSIMETRSLNKEDGEIVTNRFFDKKSLDNTDSDAYIKYWDVYLPDNVYIVGTVNMDETTFPFSRKVLDRANTIEFNNVNLSFDFDRIFTEPGEPRVLHNDFLRSNFLKLADCKNSKETAVEVINKLIEINEILEKYNYHFAYRVRDEITFYVIYAVENDLFSFEEAMDRCIVQKILPKISGSSNECFEVLIDLFEYFTGVRFDNRNCLDESDLIKKEKNIKKTLTTKKLSLMIRRFIKDGFTSFW